MATTSAVSGSTNLGGYLVRDTNNDKISDEISPDGGKTWVSASSASGKDLMTKAMTAALSPVLTASKNLIKSGSSTGSIYNKAPNKTLTDIATSKPGKVVTSIANGSAAKTLVDSITSPLDFLKALLNPFLWERIGIGALGLLFIVFGFVLMAESNRTVQTITKAVAV